MKRVLKEQHAAAYLFRAGEYFDLSRERRNYREIRWLCEFYIGHGVAASASVHRRLQLLRRLTGVLHSTCDTKDQELFMLEGKFMPEDLRTPGQ